MTLLDKAQFYKVSSFTDPSVEYQVVRDVNGIWKCGCPNYAFKSTADGLYICKHIKFVMAKIRSEE